MDRTLTISRAVPDDEDFNEEYRSAFKALPERFKLGVGAARMVVSLPSWLFTKEGAIVPFDAAETDG